MLDGVELLVKSPGVPGESPLARGCPRARHPDLERGRARLPAAARTRSSASPGRTARRRRASCSARCSAPPGGRRGRRQRRPRRSRASTALSSQDAWIVCELSSFQLEDVHELRPARRRAAQPRARPPRPPRLVRGVPRREAAHLREPDARPTSQSCRAASARSRRRRPRRVSRRRPAAGGAAASPASTTARTPPPRPPPRAPPASTTRRSPRRCARSRASRTGSSSSRELDGVRFVNDSKATNTAAARRALAAYAGQPLTLILGGSRKGEIFDELARGAAGRTSASIVPDRRGGRRARGGARRAGRRYRRVGDLATAVGAAAARRRAGRRRPALAGVRELRPVPRLRGARRRRSAGSSESCA